MHQFTMKLPQGTTATQLVTNIKQMVQDAKGTFTNNGDTGTFSIKGVSGGFSIIGDTVSITLSSKPFLVTYGMIESYIRKNINMASI